MPRSERQVPNVYFGRPGAMVTLPWPLGDMDKPFERATFDFVSGGGQHTVSTLQGGSRLYTVQWNALHVDNFAKLSQFWEGANGAGPWTFADPSVPNMLLPNQASATNYSNSPDGFANGSGTPDQGTIFSGTGFNHRVNGTRSIRWQFVSAAATSPILNLATPYRNWFGHPAVPGLPYTFSAWARPDGVIDTSVTISIRMQFLDVTGALVGSELTSGGIVATGWTQLSVTGTAPAGTAYIRPLFVLTGSTMTTGGSVYLDELQLEQDSVINPWAPGTGVRPVEILSLTDKVTFATRMRTPVTLILRELAP